MSEKDITQLINRYEQALHSGKIPYFDADEFGDLADYYDSKEDLSTVRKIIDAGLSIHPGNTFLLVKKAKLAVYDGDYENALNILQSSTEYDFDLYLLKIECYLQLEEYPDAYRLSEELLEKEDNEPLDHVLAELGFLHVEADCFKEAALYFEESLKYNPDNIEVLSDMAYSYEMLGGDYDNAIVATNKILDIESYTYEAWVNLGKLYSLKEEFEKAIDAFDFALTINDSDHNILKLKAHCLTLMGRPEEAIVIFRDLLSVDPEDTSTLLLLAECYQSLEMYDEALESLNMYQSIEGITEELQSKQAYLYLQKGDLRLATSMTEKGLEENPFSVDMNMIAGEIALRRGEFDIAENYYLSIYIGNEDNFQLLDRLAIVNIKKRIIRKRLFTLRKCWRWTLIPVG